ncbi:MAG: hypothetical protein KKH41_07570 [Candidatus Thermoplasmatota archaeon]|nr:hypothetical protein [Euryarchaeota archaeon]MBU4031229.1 hypothetical protein [Candidatus Thermoplasmatota archaeon]MBU4071001.1 hypothetical protein [Candidatus Thermoplasmatota archaeon]MBU4143744.1 hypothetical protein [Candidatus Thermoplasmatota archaeon]MBU4592427.1 hypothetical protein [Candidatus Thermoplasmatota archaeon]
MSENILNRSILNTVLQSFWLFLSILLLFILILLIYVPGLSAPAVLLSMSPDHSGTNQPGSIFFALCLVATITALHFLENDKAIKLSIILSFMIMIILGNNLFNTSVPVPLHFYGLFFAVALMIIFDAFIVSEIIATPSDTKRKIPMSSDLSERISDYLTESNTDDNLMRYLDSLEGILIESDLEFELERIIQSYNSP